MRKREKKVYIARTRKRESARNRHSVTWFQLYNPQPQTLGPHCATVSVPHPEDTGNPLHHSFSSTSRRYSQERDKRKQKKIRRQTRRREMRQ